MKELEDIILDKVKLFDKWSFKDLKVEDPGLARCISLRPILVPHSGGRHEHRHFGKSGINIVERLVNNLMRHGKSGGKKLKAISMVKNAFDIINLKTGKNPVEVLTRAIERGAPCEDTTRITHGGIVYRVSVDISPQRRVDIALRLLAEGARTTAFGNPKSMDECLADEIILAAAGDSKSYIISKKNEMERIAVAAR